MSKKSKPHDKFSGRATAGARRGFCRAMLERAISLSKNVSKVFCKFSARTLDEKPRPGEVEVGIEGDSIRGIMEPSESGGGWLARIEIASHNPLRCSTGSAAIHSRKRDSGKAS